MAAKPYHSQENENPIKNICRAVASCGSISHQVVLSKPMQPVENTSALKLSVVINNNGVKYQGSSEDNIWSQGTPDELSNLTQLLRNIHIRMSNSCEPITPVNPVVEALDAEGKKLPVKLLRKYVRCLYHEVTKLSEARVRTSRICTWSRPPADWPAHIPFQDPNNSVKAKRSSKKDLQAMFDYLTSKYKKLTAASQLSIEESSDEFLPFDEDVLLSVVSEDEGLDLTNTQCMELGSVLQQQLMSAFFSTPKPEIPIEKPCDVPNGKFISHSNISGNNQPKIEMKLGSRKIVATAGNGIEACDEVQPKARQQNFSC